MTSLARLLGYIAGVHFLLYKMTMPKFKYLNIGKGTWRQKESISIMNIKGNFVPECDVSFNLKVQFRPV